MLCIQLVGSWFRARGDVQRRERVDRQHRADNTDEVDSAREEAREPPRCPDADAQALANARVEPGAGGRIRSHAITTRIRSRVRLNPLEVENGSS